MNSLVGEEKRIYTLGTSNRSLDEFFLLLEDHGIKTVADVRRFPQSTRYPHFNRESLEREATLRILLYQWMGELLGGFRPGGYDSYKKEAAYSKGLEKLEHLAKESQSVLICAERLPWKCHRLHISKSLTERGWKVVHIIDQGRTWQPRNGSS